MELNELFNKHKNKIINAVVILVALFVSNNINKQHNSEIATLSEKRTVELNRNSKVDEIVKLDKRVISYKNLLVKRDVGQLITDLSNFASESEVIIVSLRPEVEQKFKNYLKVPFDLSVSAKGYHAIGKFISEIESSQDVFVVESFSIRVDTQSRTLNTEIRLSSLSFLEQGS
jgi:Tfp pilus assembly protein PilO